MSESFDWVKPVPLWPDTGLGYRQANFEFFSPQILEFRTDAFMQQFLATLASPRPSDLQNFVATTADPTNAEALLKLFQPAHGCFYLACSSLCCRVPGFPDRVVQAANGENVFFVLRKVIDNAEYGWIPDGAAKGWQPLNGNNRTVLAGEQRLPLASVDDSAGRTVYVGYVPVSSRETYKIAPAQVANLVGDPTATLPDGRVEELKARFTEQISQIPAVTDPTAPANITLTMSVYLLLELWELLLDPTMLPDVATALRDDQSADFSGSTAQGKRDLMTFLKGQRLNGSLTLAQALGTVANKQQDLNQTGGGDLIALGFDSSYDLQKLSSSAKDGMASGLVAAFTAALPSETQPPLELPKIEPNAAAQYVIRSVYERPRCEPVLQVVSRPSRRFQLAPFFDSDAPARPIKIPLPTDVSIAGLRKMKKGVSFMISDALNQKINRIAGKEKEPMKDSPSLNPESSDGFAFICSFSIQIIFIVAFFLLLMFVFILNIVFWWILFFRICLPVPKKLISG